MQPVSAVKNVIDSAPEVRAASLPKRIAAGTVPSAVNESEPPRPLVRAMPEAKAFPAAAMGALLADAAQAIQFRTQAPLAICAQSVLGVATLAAQAHADVVLPTGSVRPVSEFFFTVAESGERKTECDTHALWPVRKREEVLRLDFESRQFSFENEKAAWERQRQQEMGSANKGTMAEKRQALENLGPAPKQPLSPIITCPEPTFEGICRLLNEGQPSIGLFSTEGGQFIGGVGMSADNRLKTAAGLSAFWDGEPIKRVRSGDGFMFLAGRRLTINLMVQPLVAPQLLADPVLKDQGLLSRMLVSAPTSTMGTREWKEVSAEGDALLKKFSARILSVLEKPFPTAEDRPQELMPRRLPLSQTAREAWIGYVNHIEKAIGTGGALENIRGLANKLPEHAARLAGAIEIIENADAVEIGPERMANGIKLAEHYCGEALRLYEAGHVSPELRLAIRALDWIKKEWQESVISLPDLYRNGPSLIREATTARQVAKILEAHGYLIPMSAGTTVRGEFRREAWSIVR